MIQIIQNNKIVVFEAFEFIWMIKNQIMKSEFANEEKN